MNKRGHSESAEKEWGARGGSGSGGGRECQALENGKMRTNLSLPLSVKLVFTVAY